MDFLNSLESKNLIRKKAGLLHIPCSGICALPFSPALTGALKKSRDIPFVPSHLEERLDAESLLPGSKCILSFIFPYYVNDGSRKKNIALYARPVDYHLLIHRLLTALIEQIAPLFPHDHFRIIADTSPLVDRWIAYSAGLGFYGKNHCLIHPVWGSFFTIGSILTTLALPADKPLSLSCGNCSLCLKHCPGSVLGSSPFSPVFCKSYLTQKKEGLTEKEKKILRKTPLIFGCDACQECCPYNQNIPDSPFEEIHKNRILYLGREDLESCSNRGFLKKYKSYAFSWRGKKILERNLGVMNQMPDKEAGR